MTPTNAAYTMSSLLLRAARRLYRAALAAFGLSLFAPDADAQVTTFNFTGATVEYTVPATGPYVITAAGGQGGFTSGLGLNAGGRGAQVGGTFNLTAGDRINVSVGGHGVIDTFSGGGGGGSFVFNTTTASLILVAGGGGGASDYTNGSSGLGFTGTYSYGQGGGTSTLGGGGGGGGFTGNGAGGAQGGKAYPLLSGGTGTASNGNGGFGGGGGGAFGGGGGGGGFSGGNGGTVTGSAKGGDSFFAPGGLNTFGSDGFQAGNGFVSFQPVPEPATVGLLGLLTVGAIIRRRGFAVK